jgi:CheY-like chemotaxis protein
VIRLIALTGYSQASDKRRAAEAGFDAHLVKPISLETLEAVIGES